MYVTAEGFGKQSMPTNHAKEKPDIKENIKLSPKNITVLSGEMKKSAVALPIGPQHCINQVQAAQKTSKSL